MRKARYEAIQRDEERVLREQAIMPTPPEPAKGVGQRSRPPTSTCSRLRKRRPPQGQDKRRPQPPSLAKRQSRPSRQSRQNQRRPKCRPWPPLLRPPRTPSPSSPPSKRNPSSRPSKRNPPSRPPKRSRPLRRKSRPRSLRIPPIRSRRNLSTLGVRKLALVTDLAGCGPARSRSFLGCLARHARFHVLALRAPCGGLLTETRQRKEWRQA